MKRFTAFLLCAITVFTVIPASLLSVIAADNGVIYTDKQNQYYDNAATQSIPESVTVDGNVDKDTAWANNEWNEVDKNNGTWDTDSPAEESKENLTYKYQLHYDYEYFYGAIVLGKNIKDAEITVWLNDGTNSAGGYSHKIGFTVAGGSVTDNGMKDYNGNAVTNDAELAVQKYLVEYGAGDNVTIEFRRYLDSFTTADASSIKYFVSVKYKNDTLYFPRIKVEGELLSFVPTYEFWPNTAFDNHLDYQENLKPGDAQQTLSPITIDGRFDEAAWAGLTDFYLQAEDPNIVDEKENENKNTASFNTVKYNGSQSNGTNLDQYLYKGDATLGNIASGATFSPSETRGLSVNDGDEDIYTSGTTGVQFKYDYRTDGEYFYVAVVAEVPNIAWNGVTIGADDVNDNGADRTDLTYYVQAQPNFTIQFYNQTYDYFDASRNKVTGTPADEKYGGWAVEHLITFETYKLMDPANYPNYGGVFDNVTTRVNTETGKIENVNWTLNSFAQDDTYNQDMAAADYSGACSYQGIYESGTTVVDDKTYNKSGYGVWYFECRVKLESVMSSANLKNNAESGEFNIEDLGFNVIVHDRRWLHETNYGSVTDTSTGKEYKLQYAYLANGIWFYSNSYNRNAAWCGTDDTDMYSSSNIQKITTAECTGNDVAGIVVDGNLDKRNNAALAGADKKIDGTKRDSGYPIEDMQYTYILTADHEYLYGAAIITEYEENSIFRVWTNGNNSSTYENVFAFGISSGAVSLESWYVYSESGNKLDKDSADCKVASQALSNGDIRFEFRIALSDLGVDPTLSPEENEVLLAYYISVEKYLSTGDAQGLVHPRCATVPSVAWDTLHEGRIFYKDKLNKDTLHAEDGVRAYDHNDNVMLQYIAIDGKLEEEIWNEEADRTLVDGDSGRWTLSPTKNDVFEYSYSIYAGDNYIYGAVEIDVDAIAKETNSDEDYTRIELWFSNPGAYDEWGDYDEKHIYDNYLFDIYFISEEVKNGLGFAVPTSPSGSGYVYGGSTPGTTNQYYKWGMTTANGKTYAEFMISTDCKFFDAAQNTTYTRFNIDEEYGLDYFIKVIHPTETNETLELTYPPMNDMFYLTHMDGYPEGAGVIYTSYETYGGRGNPDWWTDVLFIPDGNGDWKIKNISLGRNKIPTKTVFSQTEVEDAVNAGGFVYSINHGNNYINIIENLRTGLGSWLSSINESTEYATINGDMVEAQGDEWYTRRQELLTQYLATTGHSIDEYYSYEIKAGKRLNYNSLEAIQMENLIANNWAIDRVISISDLKSDGAGTVADKVTAMLEKQAAAQRRMEIDRFLDADGNFIALSSAEEVSYVDYKKAKITTAGKAQTVTDYPLYHESGYNHIFSFSMVSENTKWDKNLPTETVWNKTNYGVLDLLEMTFPEKITVNGVLNDTGWTEDGWITVNHGINSTLQSNDNNAFQLKYQLRVDGESLYVAAVFENVAYNAANNPNFWLWINDDDSETANQSYTSFYKVGYKWDGMEENALWDCIANNPTIPALPDYYSYPDGIDSIADILSDNYKTTTQGSAYILYNNLISVRKNNSPDDPCGSDNNKSLGYEDSLFYGYTDVIEESVGGRYYPNINIQRSGYVFGKEAAVMSRGDGTAINGFTSEELVNSTVVEFCIDLDEIDKNRDGFEYFVSASRMGSDGSDFTMFYPNVYCEPDSDFSYHNYNMPFWKWYSDTSAKVTADDYFGDMYMVNEYVPVVTLGAKFNDNYGENGTNAIRFGGLYTESMIRRNSGDDTTYWDVTDMGIVVAITSTLADSEGKAIDLKLDTSGAQKASAIGIVNWVQDTNFADYESFAFYVTVAGMPDSAKSTKLSARTYICYRDAVNTDAASVENALDNNGDGTLTHGTNADDYYGQTIVRSASMIEEIVNNEIGNEQGSLPKD